MADYTTMTPGSAVSDVVQQILERRRGLERQGLLDQLGIEKYKTDIANEDRDYALRQQTEGRAQSVADAQIAADKERMFGERLSHMPWGRIDVTDLEQSDPEFYGELLKRQMIERVQPTVGGRMLSTDENGNPVEQSVGTESAPAHSFFRGSPDYQKSEDERQRIAALGSNQDFTGDDPLKMLLAGAQAGINVPSSVLPGQQHIVGPEGKTRQVIRGRGLSGVTELNWAPQPNAAAQPQLYQIPGPDGKIISKMATPSEMKQYLEQNPDVSHDVRKGNNPTNQTADILDRQLLSKLVSASSIKDKRQQQAARSAALAAISGMAQQRGVSSRVLASVADALADAQAYQQETGTAPSVEMIASQIGQDVTPQERQQFEMIIRQYMAGGR